MKTIHYTLLLFLFLMVGANASASFSEIDTVKGITDVTIFPNPVIGNATIAFSLQQESVVLIEFFDMTGKKAFEFSPQRLGAGDYRIGFDSSVIKSGIYMCKIITSEWVKAFRVVVRH